MENYIISAGESGQRLDKFCQMHLKRYSRSFVQHLIEKGRITVNKSVVKCGYILRSEDNIAITIPEPEPSHLVPEPIPLDILYEDDMILVINKPAGRVVHPGAGNFRGTLVHALLYHCKNLSGINGVLRPGIVHRLDKNTSGLLVVAKNDETHRFLAQQFSTREIVREYAALVWGTPEPSEGQIETLISRSRRDRKKMGVFQSGRNALTLYRCVETYHYLSFLLIRLKTGRTHQIRVHLNHINHPVFGDPDYNGRKNQLNRLPSELRTKGENWLACIPRQALHARSLSFIHPESKERMAFNSPLPDDFQQVLDRVKQDLGPE